MNIYKAVWYKHLVFSIYIYACACLDTCKNGPSYLLRKFPQRKLMSDCNFHRWSSIQFLLAVFVLVYIVLF